MLILLSQPHGKPGFGLPQWDMKPTQLHGRDDGIHTMIVNYWLQMLGSNRSLVGSPQCPAFRPCHSACLSIAIGFSTFLFGESPEKEWSTCVPWSPLLEGDEEVQKASGGHSTASVSVVPAVCIARWGGRQEDTGLCSGLDVQGQSCTNGFAVLEAGLCWWWKLQKAKGRGTVWPWQDLGNLDAPFNLSKVFLWYLLLDQALSDLSSHYEAVPKKVSQPLPLVHSCAIIVTITHQPPL